MITQSLLLAQDGASPVSVANEAASRLDILNHPDELLAGLADLHIVWASVFVVVGVLCVLNGYKWHKRVIVVCAFLGGLGLGKLLSNQMGDSQVAMGAIALLCAVVAMPMLRFAVAIFGALTGAFIGANAWTAFSDSPDAHLAGAAMGFIALGLATFIMFRVVIVLFTSIGGGAMAILGGITLLLQVPAWEGIVRESLTSHERLVPLLVAAAALTGIVMQQGDLRKESTEGEAEAA